MRKQKKYHYIYKTTNVVNSKYYIGMHSTDNLNDGYIGSGKRLWNSINYHGKNNHKCEILEYCKDRKELIKREEEIVNEQLLCEDLCMNLRVGGTGGISNEEHHLKMREGSRKWLLNRWENADEEFKIRFKNILLNNSKKAHKKGRIKYDTFKGKKHSDLTKQKISESMKSKGEGETNSQFGLCWITNESENKKIKKGDLIPKGWRLGRKMK